LLLATTGGAGGGGGGGGGGPFGGFGGGAGLFHAVGLAATNMSREKKMMIFLKNILIVFSKKRIRFKICV